MMSNNLAASLGSKCIVAGDKAIIYSYAQTYSFEMIVILDVVPRQMLYSCSRWI